MAKLKSLESSMSAGRKCEFEVTCGCKVRRRVHLVPKARSVGGGGDLFLNQDPEVVL